MSQPLRLGIAGLGTVGAGLLQLLQAHGDAARRRRSAVRSRSPASRALAAAARSAASSLEGMPRGSTIPTRLAAIPRIDVFVELIGGEDGVAKEAVEAALRAGKHVVTANKALLAKHGTELARLAEKKRRRAQLRGGGGRRHPRHQDAARGAGRQPVRRVYGILNGTCNYILTQMQEEHRSFADVLKEAQAKGYAEADPTFDIGGFDTAHKLALLTSLAFGTRVAFDQIHVEGIETHHAGRHRGGRRPRLPHQAARRRPA